MILFLMPLLGLVRWLKANAKLFLSLLLALLENLWSILNYIRIRRMLMITNKKVETIRKSLPFIKYRHNKEQLTASSEITPGEIKVATW